MSELKNQYWRATRTDTHYGIDAVSKASLTKLEDVTVGYFSGSEAAVRKFLEATGERLFRLEELAFRPVTEATISAYKEAESNLRDAELALRAARSGVL